MSKVVDSYRFISGITQRLVKSWIKLEAPRDIPWTPLPKGLSDCTVALISSGGIALKTDRPFDQEGERQSFDPAGPYARPDGTRLIVNRERQGTLSVVE
jgi:hypothetical protein